MCGITGVVEPGGLPDRSLLERMTRTLEHRGPDDEGFHVGPEIGLGFRRLAIVDLVTGNQPVTNESGTVVVVFNGEIYRRMELSGTRAIHLLYPVLVSTLPLSLRTDGVGQIKTVLYPMVILALVYELCRLGASVDAEGKRS